MYVQVLTSLLCAEGVLAISVVVRGGAAPELAIRASL